MTGPGSASSGDDAAIRSVAADGRGGLRGPSGRANHDVPSDSLRARGIGPDRPATSRPYGRAARLRQGSARVTRREDGRRAPNGAGSFYLSGDGWWHGRLTVGTRDDGKPGSPARQGPIGEVSPPKGPADRERARSGTAASQRAQLVGRAMAGALGREHRFSDGAAQHARWLPVRGLQAPDPSCGRASARPAGARALGEPVCPDDRFGSCTGHSAPSSPHDSDRPERGDSTQPSTPQPSDARPTATARGVGRRAACGRGGAAAAPNRRASPQQCSMGGSAGARVYGKARRSASNGLTSTWTPAG